MYRRLISAFSNRGSAWRIFALKTAKGDRQNVFIKGDESSGESERQRSVRLDPFDQTRHNTPRMELTK